MRVFFKIRDLSFWIFSLYLLPVSRSAGRARRSSVLYNIPKGRTKSIIRAVEEVLAGSNYAGTRGNRSIKAPTQPAAPRVELGSKQGQKRTLGGDSFRGAISITSLAISGNCFGNAEVEMWFNVFHALTQCLISWRMVSAANVILTVLWTNALDSRPVHLCKEVVCPVEFVRRNRLQDNACADVACRCRGGEKCSGWERSAKFTDFDANFLPYHTYVNYRLQSRKGLRDENRQCHVLFEHQYISISLSIYLSIFVDMLKRSIFLEMVSMENGIWTTTVWRNWRRRFQEPQGHEELTKMESGVKNN